MSFNLQVKVDASQALPAIQGVGDKLKLVEQNARDANAALAHGLDPAAKAFNAIADAMKREQDVLERIRGPQREYMADLGALDKLLAQNTISTKEYAEQVIELNRRIGERPKPGGEGAEINLGPLNAAAEKLEGIRGSIAGVFGGGLVMEGIEQLDRLVEASNRIADSYTKLTNAAYKFADASHSVDSVIDEQMRLAHDLHAPLEATREIYDKVREGADDLNLTHREQIDLTRVLGEAVQVANKPLGEVSGVMERLSYAMSSGTIDQRTMLMTMREIKPVADLWTEAFHMTRTELADAVAHGKVSVNDLMHALIEGQGKMAEEWSHHARTVEEWKEQFHAATELARGRGMNIFDALRYGIEQSKEALADNRTEAEKATDVIKDLTEQLNNMSGAFYEAGKAEREGFLRPIAELAVYLKPAAESLAHGVKVAGETIDAVAKYKPELSDLEKLYEEIVKPGKELEQHLVNTEILFAQGRITLSQYNDEVERLTKHNPRSVFAGQGGQGTIAMPMPGPAASDPYGAMLQGKIDQTGSNQLGDQMRAKFGTQAQQDLAKYTAEMAELAKLQESAQLPAQEYAQLQKNIGDEYEKSLEKIKDADNSFSAGMHMAFKSIADESKNVAKDFEQAFTHAIGSVNQQIVSLVQHGTFDLRGLATSIETDLLNLGLKQGEAALFGAIGGSGAGGNAALTVSTSAATDALGAFTIALGAASAALGGSGGISALSNLAALAALGGGSSSPAAGAAASDAISSARRAPSTTALQKTLAALRPR